MADGTTDTTLQGGPASVLAAIAEQAREYANHARADNTLRAYRSDWQHFAGWCADAGLQPLPAVPETIALYLVALVDIGRKPSTLQRRLSAISQAHQVAGHETPTRDARVRAVWSGIRRWHGTAQHGKTPALTADVRAMVGTLPETLLGVRDRALLLIGFAGAFRRSELVGLDVEDVQDTTDGLVITLQRSKTDQDGAGRKLGIPYGSTPATCPIRALRAWLEESGIDTGAIFRPINRHGTVQPGRLTAQSIALVVKRCAAAAGLSADNYAGHSLRAGLATSAAAAGVSERAIMAQTGHTSVIVARRYIREGSLFRDNAAARVGL